MFSLSALSEVDLSNVSQSEAMWGNILFDISNNFPMLAAAAADPAVASVAAGLRWVTSGHGHLLPAAELTAEPKSQNIATYCHPL